MRAWSVTGPDRFDGSGLMWRDGTFYVVADRHNDTIFRLEFTNDTARAVPHVKFTGPEPYPERGYLDLEGVAPAPDGGFLLAAEWGFAVAHVPAEGGKASWVTPSLRAAGEAEGLFATVDAYLEGIAVLDDAHWLLAVEREPRGLIEIEHDPTAGPPRVTAQQLDDTHHPRRPERSLDFAELHAWRGRIFALARNQHLVVELVRAEDGTWREGAAWSFAQTENAPRFRFTDMTYGQAEGLAMDEEFIYVLLDNNALGRADQPEDRRSWLFAFRNPLRRR